MVPNVYFWPGTGKSSRSSHVISRNTPEFGSTLVRLPGGVEISRSESDGRRDFFAVAHESANGFERVPMRRVHLDEREKRKVITFLELIQQITHRGSSRDMVSSGGSLPVLSYSRGQPARHDFRRFDVGLIEWVHTKDGTGHSGRKLPAIKLGAQRVPIGPVDPDDWMPRALEVFNECVGRGVRRPG